MKNCICVSVLLLVGFGSAKAQSKIKDGSVTGSSSLANFNALLELESNNKGLLLPRVSLTSTTSASPLSAHVAGMTVYNIATPINDVSQGYYFNDGTKWVRIIDGKGSFSLNIRKTTLLADTVKDDDYTIISRASAASTLSLPDPTTCKGRILVIVNHTSSVITFNRDIYRDWNYGSAGSSFGFGHIKTLGSASVFIGSLTVGNRMTIQSSGDEWTIIGM